MSLSNPLNIKKTTSICNCQHVLFVRVSPPMSTTKTVTFQNQWLDPKTYELLGSMAAAAGALAKLKLPKRKKSKRDLKQLGEEIDGLLELLAGVVGALRRFGD